MTGLSWWLWWRARRRLQDWVRAVIAVRPYRIEYRTGAGSFVDFSQALLVVEPDMPARWRVGQALPTTWGATRITRLTQLQVLCSWAPPSHQRLLATPGDLRETTEVRRLLGVEGAPWECAWTGRTLDGRFEVDHASPYSVWGNNDRWNLLPCLARVNRAKSDALPTRQLLVGRRVALVRYSGL